MAEQVVGPPRRPTIRDVAKWVACDMPVAVVGAQAEGLARADVDVPAIVRYLRARGYDNWYVLEQDTILTEEPRGDGPVADVWTSAEYLRSVLRRTR